MPKIAAIEIAVPPYRVEQNDAKDFARKHFSEKRTDIDRLLTVFDNTSIKTRYFSKPLEWFNRPHTLAEKNKTYIEAVSILATEVATRLLNQSRLSPHEIDYIIFINTTGLATPSIDARLINTLGLRNNIRRTPIWGLGCAGGVAGLAHAHHYALAHPTHRVLIVAAELCGLTFIPDDFSKSNLVASSLFGEGASAVLVTGDEVDIPGLKVVDTGSRFFPDSLDVMGWNVIDKGLQVVFAKRIPEIISAYAKSDLQDFLKRNNLTLSDISEYLFHPGGMKIIEAYQQALGLDNGKLDWSRNILQDFGNMSSVTVLFVLEKYVKRQGFGRGGYGLLSALGPGFCSETVLVKL